MAAPPCSSFALACFRTRRPSALTHVTENVCRRPYCVTSAFSRQLRPAIPCEPQQPRFFAAGSSRDKTRQWVTGGSSISVISTHNKNKRRNNSNSTSSSGGSTSSSSSRNKTNNSSSSTKTNSSRSSNNINSNNSSTSHNNNNHIRSYYYSSSRNNNSNIHCYSTSHNNNNNIHSYSSSNSSSSSRSSSKRPPGWSVYYGYAAARGNSSCSSIISISSTGSSSSSSNTSTRSSGISSSCCGNSSARGNVALAGFLINVGEDNKTSTKRYERCYSTASSRRTTDRFWLKNHVGLVVVPHQTAYVVERLGRYLRTLDSGLHFLWPVIDKVAYAHSLKEEPIVIPNQTAITKDNASYGVTNPIYAVSQLAQTTMRSELGKLTLDNTFLERDALNRSIAINQAAQPWGVTCLRYEIRDILLPPNIRAAMERQAEAERRKRADILHSEGERESAINLAKGKKESVILHAEGEATAVRLRAEAAAESVKKIAETTSVRGGMQALSLQLADNYISAFGRLAKNSNTLIVPANASDAASMLTQALTIYKNVDGRLSEAAPKGPCPPSSSSSSSSSS